MKLTGVELHTPNSSEIIELSFRDPLRTKPFNVEGITGLDADDITPRFYGGSGNSKFYNMSLGERTVVLLMSLNPRLSLSESVAGLRDQIYKLISSTRTGKIQLWFKNGTTTVAFIEGFVTKVEAPPFTDRPQIQITLVCDDALLRPLTRVTPVGIFDPADTVITDSLSTAPHGFIFEIETLIDTASLIIDDPDDDSWAFQITPNGTYDNGISVSTPIDGFKDGDILHVSSEYNNRYVYVVRSGITIQMANMVIPGSVWPLIFPGENHFELSNPTHFQWNLISYYPTYFGV